MHLAALRGQAEAVSALCEHGALINAVDDDCIAPIHKAVIHSNTEVAEELIACGADANLPLPVIRTVFPCIIPLSKFCKL